MHCSIAWQIYCVFARARAANDAAGEFDDPTDQLPQRPKGPEQPVNFLFLLGVKFKKKIFLFIYIGKRTEKIKATGKPEEFKIIYINNNNNIVWTTNNPGEKSFNNLSILKCI